MIKYTIHSSIYYVYETVNEFSASMHKDKLKPYREAEIGDYVLSHNGYYIPVVNKQQLSKKTRVGIVYRTKLVFPYYVFQFPLNVFADVPVIFKRTLNTSYKGKGLSGQELAVLKLMESGYKLVDAIKHVYKKRHFVYLIKVLSNPRFINKIEKIAMSLKDQIESQGINQEYIAKRIKSILDDDKPNATLVKYALETSINLLNQVKPSLVSTETSKELRNEIRSELSSSMIN